VRLQTLHYSTANLSRSGIASHLAAPSSASELPVPPATKPSSCESSTPVQVCILVRSKGDPSREAGCKPGSAHFDLTKTGFLKLFDLDVGRVADIQAQVLAGAPFDKWTPAMTVSFVYPRAGWCLTVHRLSTVRRSSEEAYSVSGRRFVECAL
jgi:hypothetical protein